MEIWKDIKDYEELYQISNFGRVKSLLRNSKIMKGNNHYLGYKSIKLSKKGNKRCYLIHRLVGKHFITNTENKPYINHKDGNKSNNNYKNLEWCTQKENIRHSIDILGNKPSFPKKYLYNKRPNWKLINRKSCIRFPKKVIQLSTGIIFNDIIEAGKAFNMSKYTIMEHIRGRYINPYNLAYL